MGPNLQSKDPRLASVLDRGRLVVTMRILLLVREESGLAKENKILMECYLLSELTIRGYRKHMLSLCRKRVCFGYQNKD